MPRLQLPEDHIITAADAREQARHTISMRKIRRRVIPQRTAIQRLTPTHEMVVDRYPKSRIDEITERVLEHVHTQFGVKVEDIMSDSVTHDLPHQDKYRCT